MGFRGAGLIEGCSCRVRRCTYAKSRVAEAELDESEEGVRQAAEAGREGAAIQFNSEGEEQTAERPLAHSRHHLRGGASCQRCRRSPVSRFAARYARSPGRC